MKASPKSPRRCHKFGGLTAAGQPCNRRVKDDSPCPSHAGADLAVLKKRFLKEYGSATRSLVGAARRIGKAAVTIWRWRQDDPAFDGAVESIRNTADEIRVAKVEDSMLARILRGKAAAAETIFYLVNRSAGRWRHVQHIQQQQINVDLSNLTEEELQRVANGEDPVKVLSETRVPKGPQLVEGGVA